MPASGPSHQTVRLVRGKHRSPQEGVCVMELASMLAGERFSDRPRSVCPAIAAFLRAYNDTVDDRRRADLYGCAAAVVGTRDDALVACRAAWIASWALEQRTALSALRRWRTRRMRPLLTKRALAGNDPVGWAAARIAGMGGAQTHAELLALVAELAAMSRPARPPAAMQNGAEPRVLPAVQ